VAAELWTARYEASVFFILAACLFDLLDGRLARLGGKESSFGREFDSLADVVSFGVAPALLLFNIVLYEIPHRVGWIIAAFYLVCGALRLARFNVAAAVSNSGGSKEFTGFPIPAAAGLISSITLLLLNLYERQIDFQQGHGRYVLAALMVFLSYMMFSKFRYPSFKGFSWRTEHSLPKFLLVVGLLLVTVLNFWWMPALIFLSYLLYGFFRPFLSRAWRREIEEDEADEHEASPLDAARK
jgi:CDP-diacylglycerol--serine O-phosphatidyltransferase